MLINGSGLRAKPSRRHDREEPGQDLPVAAHPAVLAPRVGEQVRGVVVHHLDVRHEGRARVDALEEVVGQERVLGHASLDRGVEGVDVEQALAGEDALAEEVLVDVGDRGGVGVDARVPGVDTREQRPGRAGVGDADARLQMP